MKRVSAGLFKNRVRKPRKARGSKGIQDDDELRRAYVLLGMMLQSYCKTSNVGDLAERTVPRQLAIPYVALRRSLA